MLTLASLRNPLIALAAALAFAVPARGDQAVPACSGGLPGLMDVGGRERSYEVHLPPGYDGKVPLPLVLCFHGGLGNIRVARKAFQLDREADRSNFILVYPQGSGLTRKWLTWNAGTCCGYAKAHHVDDLGFVRQLIPALESAYNIDRSRVYAVGFSNGGQLVYRCAQEMPKQFAAIACVSAWMSETANHPVQPISVLMMHGTKDRSIPMTGGDGKWHKFGVQINAFPIERTVRYWVEQDGCRPAPEVSRDRSVVLQRYPGGLNGTEVDYYLINGYGHEWPGGRKAWLLANRPYPYMSASEKIWRFFADKRITP